MNRNRRILATVATLACALAALATAPAAHASLPLHGGSGGEADTTVPVVSAGGMPGWQITLIAAAAALAAATLAVLIDRARASRRTHTTAA